MQAQACFILSAVGEDIRINSIGQPASVLLFEGGELNFSVILILPGKIRQNFKERAYV